MVLFFCFTRFSCVFFLLRCRCCCLFVDSSLRFYLFELFMLHTTQNWKLFTRNHIRKTQNCCIQIFWIVFKVHTIHCFENVMSKSACCRFDTCCDSGWCCWCCCFTVVVVVVVVVVFTTAAACCCYRSLSKCCRAVPPFIFSVTLVLHHSPVWVCS